MSLYNMMMGTNPYAAYLLAVLGFSRPQEQIPRLRDCYVDADNNVVVFTRTGGGNRADYAAENAALAARPGYLRDEDWDTDTTFAKWVYAPPQGQEQLVQQLGDAGGRMDPTEKFNSFIADMDSPAPKPSTQAALERAKPMVAQLAAALQGSGPAVVVVDSDKNFNVEE